jgi:hypothetical protein
VDRYGRDAILALPWESLFREGNPDAPTENVKLARATLTLPQERK